MAKYPNFGYRGMPDMGCLPTIILFILTVTCPPLGFVFLLLYGFYEDNKEDIPFILCVITILLFIIAMIVSPIIAIILLIKGSKSDIEDFWVCFLITAIDIVVAIVYILYKFLNKKSTKLKEHKEKETIIEKEKTECSNQPEETKPKVNLEKLPINTIDSTTVYITPQGKKYHHYECQCIKGRNDLIKTTISESKGKGCEPCGVCFRNKK